MAAERLKQIANRNCYSLGFRASHEH